MSVGLEPVMSSCRDKSVFKGGGIQNWHLPFSVASTVHCIQLQVMNPLSW